MISFNIKRAVLAAIAVLGSTFVAPALSYDSEALYNYYYFDANHEQIGYASDYCNRSGIARVSSPPAAGTVHVVEDIYAYCRDGQLTLN
jgi:hypothetical protein